MKPSQPGILLHPVFIISLILLLVNDCAWKYTYANAFTGKLSDFSGLFVWSLFLSAFFSQHKTRIVVVTAVLFIWWKSPLSQPLIDFLQHRLKLPVQRAVDNTDLYALIVLPLIFFIHPLQVRLLYKRIFVNLLCLFTLIAFCNTSMPYRELAYGQRENEVAFNETFISRKTEEEILQKLKFAGYHYHIDSVRFYPLHTQDLYHRIGTTDSIEKWTKVSNTKDSALHFRKKSYRPFYILPVYVLGSDTLRNLELSFYKTGRKNNFTAIQVETFRVNDLPSKFTSGKKRTTFKKHFKLLFEK